MVCCTDGELSKESARESCSQVIHRAIETALKDDTFGVIVEALPSLGKSRTVATIADELYDPTSGEELKITILTHRKETRDQIENWAKNAGLNPHQLPIFDDDCRTAAGEFGDSWRDRVQSLRKRGLPPGTLHADPSYDLPCTDGQSCPYVEGWEDCRDTPVLVGHPTHAYVSEVVRDRVVIFDEDPGEAFRMDFDSNDLHRVVSEFLADTNELSWETDDGEQPIETVDDLKSYRKFGSKEQVEDSLANLRSNGLYGDSALVGRTGGHGDARAISLGLLAKNRHNMGNRAERIELSENSVAVHDEVEGKMYVRRPPDLSAAAAIVGLDGTPVLRIWEGRLGCPSDQKLQRERVLCDDCRNRYLRDVLEYRIHQTTNYVKPYGSGHNVHQEKDLALIEAIYRETSSEPAIITTRAAERLLSEDWANVRASAHYGNIKGTNRFAGEKIQVGIVIGSQHPGDQEIKRLAALNGDPLEIPEDQQDRGKKLTYGVDSRPEEPEDPYLTHFREHNVIQAIFRFGRHDGATVFVHTGAVPDWILTEEPLNSEREVFRRARSAGEREVIDTLASQGACTPSEIIERVNIAQRTVYDRLGDLQGDGLVEKLGEKQPYRWQLTDIDPSPETGHLIDDHWYVELPGGVTTSAD